MKEILNKHILSLLFLIIVVLYIAILARNNRANNYNKKAHNYSIAILTYFGVALLLYVPLTRSPRFNNLHHSVFGLVLIIGLVLIALLYVQMSKEIDEGKGNLTSTGGKSGIFVQDIFYDGKNWVIATDSDILNNKTDGVYYSTDNANNWIKSPNTGLTDAAIAYDAVNSVYIAGGGGIDSSGNYTDKNLSRSIDGGKTWTGISALTSSGQIRDIKFANNTFMGVGYAGIAYSTDKGVTFTSTASGTTFIDSYSVDYGNGIWVITGYIATWTTPGENIWWSSNGGVGWTQVAAFGTNGVGHKVRYMNSRWVAVGGNQNAATPRIYYSTDNATTWIPTTASIQNSLFNDVYYAKDTWVAVGDDDILYSTDNAVTWTKAVSSATTGKLFQSISYANNMWVAGGDGVILYSENGKSWTTVNVNVTLQKVYYGNGYWIAGGNTSKTGNVLLYSQDGRRWHDTYLELTAFDTTDKHMALTSLILVSISLAFVVFYPLIRRNDELEYMELENENREFDYIENKDDDFQDILEYSDTV